MCVCRFTCTQRGATLITCTCTCCRNIIHISLILPLPGCCNSQGVLPLEIVGALRIPIVQSSHRPNGPSVTQIQYTSKYQTHQNHHPPCSGNSSHSQPTLAHIYKLSVMNGWRELGPEMVTFTSCCGILTLGGDNIFVLYKLLYDTCLVAYS